MNEKNTYNQNRTIIENLIESARNYPFRPCFKYIDKNENAIEISYIKFLEAVKALAATLKEKHYGKKIALCLKNSYWWAVTYYSVCFDVGVIIPLDYEMPAKEIMKILLFSDAEVIVTDEKTKKMLFDLKNKNSEKIKFYVFSDTEDSEDYLSLSEHGKNLLTQGKKPSFSNINQNNLAVLLFTSGTGSEPKGVMLSNNNICSDILSISELFDFSFSDSTHCILPLHHAYQATVMHTIISIGGCFSFSRGLRHLSYELSFFKPSIFICVPLILEKIHNKIISSLNQKYPFIKGKSLEKCLNFFGKIKNKELKHFLFKEIHNYFGGNIRFIITGAALLNRETENDLKTFGLNVFNGYGLTECSPIVICNSPKNSRIGSIGKPVKFAQAKIENPNSDGIGEICVKGPMIILGYFKDEAETSKTIIDSWLYTGDLGYKDTDGFYYIAGRSKNVIVTKNGKNIYPEEIENILTKSSLIEEAFVFSEDKENENIVASVIPDKTGIKKLLKKKLLTDEEIYYAVLNEIKSTNKKLPSYKAINKLIIRNEAFDMTSTHKIKRFSDFNKKE